MTTDNVEIILTAQDRASRPVKAVEDKLLGMSRSTRLLKREFRGLGSFAGALDQIAGTRLGGVINDMQLLAEVAHPLKDFGGEIAASVSGAFTNLRTNPKVASALARAGDFMGTRLGKVAGLAAKGALVVGVAEAADQLSGPINKLGEDTGRRLFGGAAQAMGSTEQRGILYGTIVDSMTDATHDAIATVWSPNSPLNRFHVWDHAHGLFYMSPETGKNIGRGMLKTVSDGVASASSPSVWSKSAQTITGDLSTALQNTPDVVNAALVKAQMAARNPNALAGQEAVIQKGIDKINALAAAPNVSEDQRIIFDQSRQALQDQYVKISAQQAPGSVYGPPAPQTRVIGPSAVYGPPAPQVYGPPVPAGFVSPHSHDIYINGNKVMDALDPVMGKRMAMASRAPYTRN